MNPVQIGEPTTATTNSRCCYCDDPITPGDTICPVDLEWAHETCVDWELW